MGFFLVEEVVAVWGIDWVNIDRERVGVYIGVTEHGNVETENEIYEIKGYDYDTSVWSHHHNPRTVANNPAGEISLNLGITGPHYTVGAACAAGNAGIIQGAQMLRLHEVDVAIAGGVSESIHTFGIFASFKSQGALATHADLSSLSDKPWNEIVVDGRGNIYLNNIGFDFPDGQVGPGIVALVTSGGLVRQVADAWPNVFRQGEMIPAVEYLRANRIRTLLLREMEQVMSDLDVLVMPSFVGDTLLITNLTGHPALCLPNGFRGDGLPTSVTFTGKLHGEAELTNVFGPAFAAIVMATLHA